MFSLTTRSKMPLESHDDRAAAFEQTIAGAMSRELHKTAQPLTILQGLIELMIARTSSGDSCGKFHKHGGEEALRMAGCDECRLFLERAGEEVPRLASSFESVRNLAALQRPAQDVAVFPLAPLVTDVVQDLGRDFELAGITVTVDRFDDRPGDSQDASRNGLLVNASSSRVSTAVRLVLSMLVDCLRAGDQVWISIETDGGNAAIKFQLSRPSQVPISQHDLLPIALTSQLEFASLLFASVGGALSIGESPDLVVLSMPTVASPSAAQDMHRRETHV
jgi:signal transduction histidine kinase